MSQHYLVRYLKLHFAGAEAGYRRFQQAAKKHRGTEAGDVLLRIAEEVRDDRAQLFKLLRRFGEKSPTFLKAGAIATERAARLKLNVHYSPLSRVQDLEGLLLGVTGKLSMWRALRDLAKTDRTLVLDYDALIGRALKQLQDLELLRRAAARDAFGRTAGGLPSAFAPHVGGTTAEVTRS